MCQTGVSEVPTQSHQCSRYAFFNGGGVGAVDRLTKHAHEDAVNGLIFFKYLCFLRVLFVSMGYFVGRAATGEVGRGARVQWGGDRGC